MGRIFGKSDEEKAAEKEAERIREVTMYREWQQRQIDRASMGRIRALVGTSGVTMEGSPLAVLQESARQAEVNAYIIKRGGELAQESVLLEGKQRTKARRYQQANQLIQNVGSLLSDSGPSGY